MATIASFHLVRESPGWTPVALARLASDRRRWRSVAGLRFVRLLGTGRAADTSPSIDPRRTAVFAVWDHEDSLDRFLLAHPIARGWRDADEVWHVRLRALGGHGAWRGHPVLDGMTQGGGGGPVALITRADVRLRSWPAFAGAARRIAPALAGAPGLLATVGIGEAPFGRLGTFSLWESAASLERFAASDVHADVVLRARRERWYGEELFARFEPYDSSGTWAGRDPLSGPTSANA